MIVSVSRMVWIRSMATAVCAIVLLIFARSCTGLKNLLEIGQEHRQRAYRHGAPRG